MTPTVILIVSGIGLAVVAFALPSSRRGPDGMGRGGLWHLLDIASVLLLTGGICLMIAGAVQGGVLDEILGRS